MRTGRSLRRWSLRLVALGVVWAVLALSLPASASVAPEDLGGPGGGAAAGPRPRPTGEVIGSDQIPMPVSAVWTAGRRGYFLDSAKDLLYEVLVAVDLDTGLEVGRIPLPFGATQIAAVDEGSGRLYVLEGINVFEDARDVVSDGGISQLSPEMAAVQGGSTCIYTNGGPAVCVTAMWEVDARSLTVGRRISLPSLRADGLMVTPQVSAVAFSPSLREGDGAKLLVVRRELLWGADDEWGAFMQVNASRMFVSQIDVGSGAQEWSVPLDACKSGRYLETGKKRPAGAAAFRDPRPGKAFVYVACHSGGKSESGTVVRVPLDAQGVPAGLPVALGDPATAVDRVEKEGPEFRPAPSDVGGLSGSPDVFVGPERTFELRADEASGRVLMTVVDGSPPAQVVWVFDAFAWRMLGTIGIGQASGDMTDAVSAGVDWVNGRMYTLIKQHPDSRGGLYLVDFRRSPLAQALYFPNEDLQALGLQNSGPLTMSMLVLPGLEGAPSHLYVPNAVDPWSGMVEVEDPVPFGVDAVVNEVRRSLSLMEEPGVTSVASDGAARGFGARMLLIGGVEGATRVGPVDPIGNVLQWHGEGLVGTGSVGPVPAPLMLAGGPHVPCGATNREVVLGFVGPRGAAVVDGAGSRGAAEPVVTDSATAADAEALVSRCGTVVNAISDWERLWAGALFGRPPIAEPVVEMPGSGEGVECVSSDQPSAASGDPVSGSFAARVECGDADASGFAYTRGFAAGAASVGEALSSFRIYHDPGRGIVARVESVARGIHVDGVLHIDSVRGTAESWANGQSQPVPAAEREAGYDPNCDVERSAGTCYRRNVFGVWTPGYSCGPCGDEVQLVDRLNKGFGSYGSVRFRQPDPELAAGSEDGFSAAVQKPDTERFADLVLNSDLLQTMVPSLEIVRYAPPNRVKSAGGPRGRQIYQFAGVEVSSSYSIQCLLVYDVASNTCKAATDPPGSITVSLADGAGAALAGGVFEVRRDVDTDGIVGLADVLVAGGACATEADGVGSCVIEGLAPGSYLVFQTTAPTGYTPVADPYAVELASGEARTVAFTNTSDVSTIQVSVADEAAGPVAGARFAVYPDPDSDGKIAANTPAAAECMTDTAGVCSMQVKAGSYVLVQTAASVGLVPIEPVAFTFAMGGQTATVKVVNYPADSLPPTPPAASPVYTTHVETALPIETVDDYIPPTPTTHDEPQVDLPQVVGGTIVRILAAPGDGFRLLAREPRQAVAWTATLVLLLLAVAAVRRRNHAITLIGS